MNPETISVVVTEAWSQVVTMSESIAISLNRGEKGDPGSADPRIDRLAEICDRLAGLLPSGLPVFPIGSRTSGTHNIPANAIGFTYCLSGAGGGGGAGGLTCGGGGGGASDFVEDRIPFADLIQQMGVPLENLSIESQLGTIGLGGVGLNSLGYGNSGESGGESRLIIRAVGLDSFPIVLAVAKGGFGSLGGTAFHGFGFGEFGTTYTGEGGMGELAKQNIRSRDGPDRRSINLNHYGDGGNGGAIGSPGLPGKPAYFSIEFFS